MGLMRLAAAVAKVPVDVARGIAVKALTAVQADVLRQLLVTEAGHFLSDIEWRYEQTRDLLDRMTLSLSLQPGSLDGLDAGQIAAILGSRQVTAEDLNLTGQHHLTGYTTTNNSPVAGSIAWAGLHIVYQGVDNAITDGNTALKYAWWQKATSQTVLQTSNTKPTLGPDDFLVFVNNGGTAVVAGSDSFHSLPTTIGNGSVDAAAIIAGAVGTSAIASGAVTAASGILASGAVTSTAIGAGAVGTTAIASGAVTAASGILATGAVTATTIASGAVGTTAIASGAVTAGSGILATGAVTSTAIASGAVGTTAIAAGAVTAASNILAAGAVTSTALGSGAVGTTALATGAVTATILGAGAVTATKLNILQHTLY